MKGRVSDRYIAIIPDEVEETIKEGALKGFITDAGVDPNKKARMELASQIGTVYQVGSLAYDYTDESIAPDCEVGDRVWFVRHVAKVVEDNDDLNEKGKPKKIFIMTPDNLVWNEGKDE